MPSLGASDLNVFPLALGTNSFGWTASPATSRAILDAFVAGGGNFIDTADTYSYWVAGNSGGEAEAILGDWLAARGKRPDVVVATKVSGLPAYAGLRAANIAAAVVGGVAVSGGRGKLWGVFVGLLLLACISPALTHLHIEAYWEKAIQGAIILLAVVADGLRRRKENP